jgi:hypothetical protein
MFTVVDKVIDHSKGIYWYRVDVWDSNMKSWVHEQPTALWAIIEYGNLGTSYVVREELYTLLQLTWSK